MSKDLQYFVTGIGTDVGKTFVSKILVNALNASYWKPVQAGLEETDKASVLEYNKEVNVLPGGIELKAPMSPHAAAALEGKEVRVSDIKIPSFEGNVIVEGAGGLMVPLNNEEMIIDLIKAIDLEVILVASIYLGSINHTLLSIEALVSRGIKIKGIIFNGDDNKATTSVIEKYTGIPVIEHLPRVEELNDARFQELSNRLKEALTK